MPPARAAPCPRFGRIALAVAALAVAACATPTRVSHFGRLGGGESLVTLVLTEDTEVVRRECLGRDDGLPVFGCEMSRLLFQGRREVLAIKIVRYTDFLPSELAQEIDAHELCHAVASLQHLEDPCHAGNLGFLQSPLPPRLVVRPY